MFSKKKWIAVLMVLIMLISIGCDSKQGNGVAKKEVVEAEVLKDHFDKFYVDLLNVNPLYIVAYNGLEAYGIEGELDTNIYTYTEQEKRLKAVCDKYESLFSSISVDDPFLSQQLEIALYDIDEMQRRMEYSLEYFMFDELDDQLKYFTQYLTEDFVIESEDDMKAFLVAIEQGTDFLKDVNELMTTAMESGFIVNRYENINLRKQLNFFKVSSSSNKLVTSFKHRCEEANIDAELTEKYSNDLLAKIDEGFTEEMKVTIDTLANVLAKRKSFPGLGNFEDGAKVYSSEIMKHTTTEMTAEEIHALGLKEVARLQEDLDKTLRDYGLTEGSIAERLEQLRAGDDTYIGDASKARYNAVKDEVVTFLPTVFYETEIPSHGVVIEHGGYGNYYRAPKENDLDSKGQFFLGMSYEHSDFDVNTLAYHEMIPGHHLQRSLEVELDLPAFREFDHFTAYIEGWALYAEHMMDEEFDKDPKYHIGYVHSTLFRAVRLVVDTGLHDKGWTEAEARDYMIENAFISYSTAKDQIDRYVRMPGQALAYKIGQLEILALRDSMKEKYGDDFDIKEFHHIVLRNGSLPLSLLRENVEAEMEKVN